MPNIVLQDLTAMIHHTSRFNGNQFDMVHVETLLRTDVPVPPEMQWYVPSGTTIPNEVLNLLKATNLAMYPMAADYVTKEVNNILQASQSGNLQEVMHDSTLLMLQAIMVKKSFTPVVGTNNLYHLAYDYKLFPNKDNPKAFDFKVVLPFHGLCMPNGSRVQMTVIMPITAKIDPNVTEGITVGGQKIQELTYDVQQCQRQIVCFMYQKDPEFTIRYIYP